MKRDRKWLRIAAWVIGAVAALFAIGEIHYLASAHHFDRYLGGFIFGLLTITYRSIAYAIKPE